MGALDITVKVKKLREGVGELSYATEGSAGVDLRAAIDRPIVVRAGQTAMVPTGVSIELPSKHYASLIFARSGLASKYGITMANGVGIIDSDYRGEYICPILNTSSQDFVINPGDRIAQVVFVPVAIAKLVFVDDLSSTQRGDGGFGSSGIE